MHTLKFSLASISKREFLSLKQVALSGDNLFKELMKTVRVCCLGQITHLLYEFEGQYRKNMEREKIDERKRNL